MKLKKDKNNEAIQQAAQANAAADVMEELDDAELQEYSGAGNPFANRPRMNLQSIDDDLRSNG